MDPRQREKHRGKRETGCTYSSCSVYRINKHTRARRVRIILPLWYTARDDMIYPFDRGNDSIIITRHLRGHERCKFSLSPRLYAIHCNFSTFTGVHLYRVVPKKYSQGKRAGRGEVKIWKKKIQRFCSKLIKNKHKKNKYHQHFLLLPAELFI